MTEKTLNHKFGRLVEACGKVLVDVGKNLSQESGGPNPALWLRELRLAIRSVEDAIDPTNRCVLCAEPMSDEHQCPEQDGAKEVSAALGLWLWQEVTDNPGKLSPEIGMFWRNTAQSIYRLGQSSGRIEMRKAMAGARPVGDRPVKRVWRQLPLPYNGKPVWALQDDDSDHDPGVIIWDYDEPAGWLPIHEDARLTPSLSDAMSEVERHLGVVGAERPSIEVKPDEPWPTTGPAEPDAGKSSGSDPAEVAVPGRNPDLEALGRLERTVLIAERKLLREALQAIVDARIIPHGKKSVPIERLTEAVDRAAALLNRG